jgi:hypothetical protein
MHNSQAKTHQAKLRRHSTPRVDLTTFRGRFQTFSCASAQAHFLRVYLNNNLLLVFGHKVC